MMGGIDRSAVRRYLLFANQSLAATKMISRPRPQGDCGKSPFRYPGGKAVMLPEIHAAICSSPNSISTYAEPFAGGAGAAIELLALGHVQKIVLNDADERIVAAWRAMLDESSRFIDRIRSIDLTIDTWRAMNQIVKYPKLANSNFDLGFATFFMNRTNRSGIVVGAGPIGGYEQSGEWKLGARFYRDTIAARIEWLAHHRTKIAITNLDGIEFLRSFRAERARSTFFFIDPPYVRAGSRLYLDAMNEKKHRKLAAAIRNKPSLMNWLMTYDDHPLIHEIYSYAQTDEFAIRYSLQKRGKTKEIVIRPVI